MTVIEDGHFRVALMGDAPRAAFRASASLRAEAPADERHGCGPRRVVVEFHRAVGGLPQQALIGGVWSPRSGRALQIEVTSSGLWADEERSYLGELGHRLIPGLPEEYASAVLPVLAQSGLPPGDLSIDRAAHHPVESSPLAFTVAAQLLVAALAADSDGMVCAVRQRLVDLRRSGRHGAEV